MDSGRPPCAPRVPRPRLEHPGREPSTVLRRAPETDAPREPVLEYVGVTSLSVTGAVTGRTYRFEKPGARVSVSRHDAWVLLQAPVLRLVGSRQSRPRT